MLYTGVGKSLISQLIGKENKEKEKVQSQYLYCLFLSFSSIVCYIYDSEFIV